VALPRHLLLDAYERSDKQGFLNNQYWTREFVGLGPYRLGEWEFSSHTEGLAFDQYFLGRPKIDRVVFRYFGDVNSLVAEQRGLARYPYDLQRAQRLMGEAGWTRGADGTYRSAAGEPLALEVRSTDKSDNVRENQAVAAQLKEAGMVTSTVLIPDGASSSV